MRIQVNVNGEPREADVEPRLLLVHFIRDHLGLTGTHWGCDTSNCGACTVHPVRADGHEVTTIEGLWSGTELTPVQEGFRQEHGLQCGFCTPGMIMTGSEFLERNPNPTEEEIRQAISGNLCRCTGYENIVKAIQWAASNPAREEVGA